MNVIMPFSHPTKQRSYERDKFDMALALCKEDFSSLWPRNLSDFEYSKTYWTRSASQTHAHHGQLSSRFRECQASDPNANYGFSVFPVSPPLLYFLFVWTRNNFICVCSRCWKEAAHCEYCLELASFSCSEKLATGSSHEAEESSGKQSLLVLFKQVGLCCYSSEIRHAKCSQSALSTWLTSKVVCQCRHQEDIYTTTYKTVQMYMWVPEGLAGFKLPTEPGEHVALPLMHGKWLATFLLVMKYIMKIDILGIFVKIFDEY